MHLKCKHRTTFCSKLRLHRCPYSRVMTNLARTPKSAILWDFAKGGARQNAQKSRPTIGASKTAWRKWHHLLISMHLKCKHRTTFCFKLRLHKCPYSRVMTNLARTPKSAISWDSANGGPRQNAQKSSPTIGASKTPWRKWHHLMHLKCKHRTTFCCKLWLHKCPYSRVMTNLARTPKSAIFWEFAKGGPRGRYKSRTGSTWIADLNKNSTYSRTRHATIGPILIQISDPSWSGPTFVPAWDQGKMLKKVGRL